MKALIALVCAVSLTSVSAASAAPQKKQSKEAPPKSGSPVSIGHSVPAQLPRPGAPLTLEIEFLHSAVESKSSTPPTVQLIASRDGEFITLPVEGGLFNERENPSFSVTIPAPESDLRYQFVAKDNEGAGIASAHYQIQRSCREPLTVPPVPNATGEGGLGPKELLARSIQTSEALQYDIQDLKRAVGTLQELTEVLNR